MPEHISAVFFLLKIINKLRIVFAIRFSIVLSFAAPCLLLLQWFWRVAGWIQERTNERALDKNDQNAAHTNRYNLEMLSIFCLPEDLHNTKSYVSCAIVKPFFSFSLRNYDDEPRIFAIFLSSNEMIYLLAHRDITHMRIAHKPIHSHLIANIAFVCALWSD